MMERIFIYCMGDYGLETYFRLKRQGIKIDYFADRALEKKGYALEGLYCRSYEELLNEDRESCTVVVAIKNPEALIVRFKQEGFQKVYDKETAIEMLAGENSTKKQEPLRDIQRIEAMKQNIQKIVYENERVVCGEPEHIIRDYLLRHDKPEWR